MLRTSLLVVVLCASPAGLGAGAVTAAATEMNEIVIEASSVEPSVLRTVSGKRVDFVNRAKTLAHVEFAGDARQHDLIQVGPSAPVWVIFHRPGTHAYVVHVGVPPNVRTLSGLVEVAEDLESSELPSTCGFTVMGECFEP